MGRKTIRLGAMIVVYGCRFPGIFLRTVLSNRELLTVLEGVWKSVMDLSAKQRRLDWQQSSTGLMLCLSGFLVLGSTPGWASEALSEAAAAETEAPAQDAGTVDVTAIPRLTEQNMPATTVEEWTTQIAQAQVTITSVRVEETAAGLQVVLETAEGDLPAPNTQTVGNALIAEIPNAVLDLPEGEPFEQFGPAAGIALVSVTNQPEGGIRVSITGTDAPPQVEVSIGMRNVVFSVTPENAAADVDLDTDTDEDAIQVVVTATRTEEDLQDIPRSVTVITREEIEAQTTVNRRNLEDILAQLIPGASPPSGRTLGTFTLRGQGVSILIDGIPQDTNSNNTFSAPLSGLDPSSIERIEVIRGPNAIFGGQAIGGLINIITRRPDEGQVRFTTEVGVNSALTNLEDGQGYTIAQQVSGTSGSFDYTAGLTYDAIGQSYDAEGDRIGDGFNFDNTRNFNGLLNLGVNLSEQERLQLGFNYYQSRRVSDFIQDTSTDEIPGIQKARLIRRPEGTQIIGARDGAFFQTTNVTLSYSHEDLLGSELQGQLYYRNYRTDGEFPFDNRLFGGTGISFQRGETDQLGARLQINTPFNADETVSLLWGADFANERISQDAVFFDTVEFDASGGLIYRKIDEAPFIPLYSFNDLGLFAQLQWRPSDQWVITGGTRYVVLNADVDDYQAISLFSDDPPRDIEGGNIDAAGFVFNIGTVYSLTDNLSTFASFGQGFSFPDLGRVLRRPPGAISSFADTVDLNSPIRVDNYELGLRGNWDNLQASLAAFFSYSDSGFDLLFNPDGTLRNVRAPRQIYGIEGTLDWQPAPQWRLGGTVSWQEGELDEDDDGEFLAFDSFTIAPLKITAYLENQTTPGWRNRLQLLYSGNRDRGFNDGSDGAPIDEYLTLDLLSTLDIGDGELTLGIRNLFNTQYFPVAAQATAPFFDPGNYAGPGTNVSLSYRFTW